MKKFFSLLLSFVLLTACSKNTVSPKFPGSYCGIVNVTYNDCEYSADALFKDNVLKIVIVKPETMKGFEFLINNEDTIVRSNSFELNYKTEKIDDFCPWLYLYHAMRLVNAESPTFKRNTDSYVAEISSNGNYYEFFLDKETEKITRVKCDTYDFIFKA